MAAELDAELQAMQAVIEALEPLDGDARDRVIGYAFGRLDIPTGGRSPAQDRPSAPVRVEPSQAAERQNVVDVRSLCEEKQPKSANEMAALVGYYLAELAPPAERKAEITKDDIATMFKQAKYPLPKRVDMTLPNATSAGYFESIGGGQYRLNPVGHNLVAHTLPRADTGARRRASKPKPKKKASTSAKK